MIDKKKIQARAAALEKELEAVLKQQTTVGHKLAEVRRLKKAYKDVLEDRKRFLPDEHKSKTK